MANIKINAHLAGADKTAAQLALKMQNAGYEKHTRVNGTFDSKVEIYPSGFVKLTLLDIDKELTIMNAAGVEVPLGETDVITPTIIVTDEEYKLIKADGMKSPVYLGKEPEVQYTNGKSYKMWPIRTDNARSQYEGSMLNTYKGLKKSDLTEKGIQKAEMQAEFFEQNEGLLRVVELRNRLSQTLSSAGSGIQSRARSRRPGDAAPSVNNYLAEKEVPSATTTP